MRYAVLVLLLAWPLAWLRAGHVPCSVQVRTNGFHTSVSSLDQQADTLRHDDNVPRFVFRYPDAFGDDFRNQRFRAPQAAALVGALFVFPTRGGVQWTTGDPDLLTLVWVSGLDSLPDANQVLLRDTLEFGAFASNIFELDSTWTAAEPQFVYVDLLDHNLLLDSAMWFHLGYSAIRDSGDDSLAVLSDDGNPETSNASEYYNGSFVLMRTGWRGVNFFIRAVIETETGLQVIAPPLHAGDYNLLSAYPNPFNGETKLTYIVQHAEIIQLQVFDLAGRLVAEPRSEFHAPGQYQLNVAGNDWSSGAYFIRLHSPSQSATLKILLAK